MKKLLSWILPVSTVMLSIIIYACNKQLNLEPQGSLLASNVNNNSGVQGLLIGAYTLLSGENVPGQNLGNGSAASNYVYGSEAADDSYKGSSPSDQPDGDTHINLVIGAGKYQLLSGSEVGGSLHGYSTVK